VINERYKRSLARLSATILGYSSVPSGHEDQFLELSERMVRRVDGLTG
jgi:hypothetical protein